MKSGHIGVLELRNYELKAGCMNSFTKYFKTHFIESQKALGAYILGQYSIKGVKDRFFWMRGFSDMQTRLTFLKDFYSEGETWREFGPAANAMMIDSDNVHLLKPLNMLGTYRPASEGIELKLFEKDAENVKVNYFTVKEDKMDEFIDLMSDEYLPLHKNLGIEGVTLWVSELQKNDYPRLPVIQNKNLLVSIAKFKNENKLAFKFRQFDSVNTGFKVKINSLVSNISSLILHQL